MKKVSVLVLSMSAATAALAEDALMTEFHMDSRFRYEMVDQDNALETAKAGTMRFRPRIESTYGPIGFLAEGEITAEVGDSFNSTRNKETQYSVVADPANFQVNRLQLGVKEDLYDFTVGRQEINLDNQRFIGSVGWRQNDQTMDAVRLNVRPTDKLSLGYGYIDKVNTIFGIEGDAPGPAAEGEQDTHVQYATLNSDFGAVGVEGYGFWMKFDELSAWSNKTFGGVVSAKLPYTDLRAEYAVQSDYGNQPLDYDADYMHVSLTAKELVPKTSFTAGYELLGSDDGKIGFQTPLATKHKFNGWADIFLVTPAAGLQDVYVNASTAVPVVGGKFVVQGHKYDSDEGSLDYGSEVSGLYVRPIKSFPGLKGLVKYSHYNAKDAFVDTDKLWVQLDYSL